MNSLMPVVSKLTASPAKAGRETETYSSLLNLGVPKSEIENAPTDDSVVKVQFVDIHGEPLQNAGFPLKMLDYDPALTSSAGLDEFAVYQFGFSGADRTIKFKLKRTRHSCGRQTRRILFALFHDMARI